MAEPLLVVGLGNPGENYARTRHNLGFMVADLLAARLGSKFKTHKRSGAEIVTGRLAGHAVVLAKPRCYMNESGRQVGPLAKFYSVPAADVLIIHDELDLDFGQIRLKLGGGEGGHVPILRRARRGSKFNAGAGSVEAARGGLGERDGDDGRRLDAQDARAEADGHEARGAGLPRVKSWRSALRSASRWR